MSLLNSFGATSRWRSPKTIAMVAIVPATVRGTRAAGRAARVSREPIRAAPEQVAKSDFPPPLPLRQ